MYRRFDNRKCLIVQEWKGVETFEKAFFGAPLVPSTIKLNDARRNMCFRIASEDGILVYFEPDPSSIWVVSIAFFREWAETGVRPPRPQLWYVHLAVSARTSLLSLADLQGVRARLSCGQCVSAHGRARKHPTLLGVAS